MDSDVDSFAWSGPLETCPPLWSSDLYALCLQNSHLPDNSCDCVTESDAIFDNPTNYGLDLVEQFLAGELSDAVADKLGDSLAPGGVEGVLDTVPKITEYNKPSSISSGCTAGKGPKRSRSKARKTSGDDGEEQKRTKRLELNRIAAKKCRKKRREQVASLREKEAALEMVNMRMRLECTQIKDEINKLKVFVMMHALQSKPNNIGIAAEQVAGALDGDQLAQ